MGVVTGFTVHVCIDLNLSDLWVLLQDQGDTAVSTTTARDRKYSSDSHTSRSLSTPDNGLENGQ